MTLFARTTNDRTWVWKPLNKARSGPASGVKRGRPWLTPGVYVRSQVMRGQTLITRTMAATTFDATYVAVHLPAPPGGNVGEPTAVPSPTGEPSSAPSGAQSMLMERAQSVRWLPPGPGMGER